MNRRSIRKIVIALAVLCVSAAGAASAYAVWYCPGGAC